MIFQNVGVVGAGTMGYGIALTFAKSGCTVTLVDSEKSALSIASMKIDKSLDMFIAEGLIENENKEDIINRINYSVDLESLSGKEYILECISEKIEPKRLLFKRLDEICSPAAVLSSNTSSLKLSDITKDVIQHKDKVILTHWFNPGHIVPLVELLRLESTSNETFEKTKEFYEQCGKVTIEVKKEVPGLVANRIQIAMAREVFSLYEQEVASAEDIDKAITAGPGFRLSVSGLLEIADLGGLDIWFLVLQHLLQFIDSGKEPNQILSQKIKENKLGAKNGIGFYEYPGKNFDHYVFQRDRKLLKQLKFVSNLMQES